MPGVRLMRFGSRAAIVWLAIATSTVPAAEPRFERDVWPILFGLCVGCHGAGEPQGNLDLRTVASMLRGGDVGPALVPAQAEASLLLARIDRGEMPPEGERQLTAQEIDTLRAWVAGGAAADDPTAIPPAPSPVSDADRQYWAFRTLARPAVPAVVNVPSVRTPIDAFLLARLEERGLAFSPEADRVTLLRRAHLDLIGLPPAPTEVDAFLADDAPGAYERAIDRLLASPHFGERWGRHWLDVAGYVDTVGFDTDATNIILSEGKWRYRDYVIDSFNADKPYDRFLVEQLAGDELHDWRRAERFTPEIREALVATGFLRTARDYTHEDVGVIPQNFYGIVHDTLEIVGTGLLGLTVQCARCHSHKFDPLPQEDYYRLMAAFLPAYNPHDWRAVLSYREGVQDRTLADVSPAEQAEIEAHNRAIAERVDRLRAELESLRAPHRERLLSERLTALPEAIRVDVQTSVAVPAEQRSEVQRYLAEKFGALLAIPAEEVAASLGESDRATAAALEAAVSDAESQRRGWGKIQALWDLGPPPPAHLLIRGEYENPGAEVPPGFFRVLCEADERALATASSPSAGTSGRRLALARWLTEADSPAAALLTRVHVNRIWQKLFGRGIVPSPENFGAQGERPTHPELLEWLSAQFVAGGWRVKPLLRLMVTSTAYRQASRRAPSQPAAGLIPAVASVRGARVSTDPDPELVDPGNTLWWRMPLRRLEGEIVRDSILTVSGQLNYARGGPPILTEARPDGAVVVAKERLADPADACRRSVYLLARRAYNLSLLTVFDQPQVATNCLCRDASAVPLQSLTMLNDEFQLEQAAHFAERVERESGPSAEDRVAVAFRLALARCPNADESAWCVEFLARQQAPYEASGLDAAAAGRQSLAQLCHTLFNSSEFLYAE